MRTVTPVSGIGPQKTAVEFGLAKIASLRSLPTLRRSMSNAAATSMSPGRYPPIFQCISPTLSCGSLSR